jgi:GTP cyclohydrolase I
MASKPPSRPDRSDAVRALIRWAGDDSRGSARYPGARRAGLFFAGHLDDPVQIVSRTFSEVDGYDEMIVMTDIRGGFARRLSRFFCRA